MVPCSLFVDARCHTPDSRVDEFALPTLASCLECIILRKRGLLSPLSLMPSYLMQSIKFLCQRCHMDRRLRDQHEADSNRLDILRAIAVVPSLLRRRMTGLPAQCACLARLGIAHIASRRQRILMVDSEQRRHMFGTGRLIPHDSDFRYQPGGIGPWIPNFSSFVS